MFKYLMRFIKALNANSHPGDIAHAVALGLLLALVPKGNLLWPFLFILAMFIRMNKGAFFLSFILFSFIVPFADVPVERFEIWFSRFRRSSRFSPNCTRHPLSV